MSDAVNTELGSRSADKTAGLIRGKAKEKARDKGMSKLQKAIFWTGASLIALEGAAATATEITDGDSFLKNPTQTWGQQAGYDMSHPFDWIKNIINPDVPSTFDNSKAKQLIGENNIRRITPEEAEKQDLLTPKITVDPIAKTITISTLFTTSPANEPILPTTLDRTYHAPGEISLAPDDPRNSFGSEHREVTANHPIILPKGTHYALVTGGPGSNSSNPNFVIGFFYDPQANVAFSIWYYNEKQLPFNPDPKSIDWETYKKNLNSNGESFPVSDGINPITTTMQQQSLDYVVDAVIGNDILSYNALTSSQTRLKVNLTHPTQDGKLLGLSPQQ